MRQIEWKVGDYVEYECTDPDYRDTLHPARILAIDPGSATVTLKYVAFADEEPAEPGQPLYRLHAHRPVQPNRAYRVGDRVHFLCFARKVRGRKVDGYAGEEEGVWVKGTVVQLDHVKDELLIRHVNWDVLRKTVYMDSWIAKRHIRPAFYEN